MGLWRKVIPVKVFCTHSEVLLLFHSPFSFPLRKLYCISFFSFMSTGIIIHVGVDDV